MVLRKKHNGKKHNQNNKKSNSFSYFLQLEFMQKFLALLTANQLTEKDEYSYKVVQFLQQFDDDLSSRMSTELFTASLRKKINSQLRQLELSSSDRNPLLANLNALAQHSAQPKLMLSLYKLAYLKTVNLTFASFIDWVIEHSFGDDITGAELLAQAYDIDTNTILNAFEKGAFKGAIISVNNDFEPVYSFCLIDSCELLFSEIVIPNVFITALSQQTIHSMEDLVEQTLLPLKPNKILTAKHFDHDTYATVSGYLSASIKSKNRGVNILIHGAAGVGKSSFVYSIAQQLKLNLLDLTVSQHDSDDNLTENMLGKLTWLYELTTYSQRSCILVEECEDFFYSSIFDKKTAKDKINKILENNHLPCFWLTNSAYMLDPAYVRRFDIVIEMKAPNREQLIGQLKSLARGLWLSENFLANIAEHDDLTVGHFQRAFAVTKTLALTGKQAQQKVTQLLNGYLDVFAQKNIKTTAKKTIPLAYDLSLTNAQGDSLSTIIKGVDHIGAIRLMLYGPSGTGKTAFAKHLSEQLDKMLIVKKASDLLGKYVGESEQKIAEAFALAQAQEAVLLIDEFDSFMQSREGHQQGWETTMVNEMLTQLEDFTGVFIATTNFNDNMDHAVTRRFDFKIKLDYLKVEQIMTFIRQLVPKASQQSCATVLTLTNLTAGDFAVVARKCALINDYSLKMILHYLSAESRYKYGNAKPIGFLRN